MTALAELIPEARSLSRVDTLRLIQLLAKDLAGGEGGPIEADAAYDVWSPDSAFDAADVMLRTLADEGRS